MIVKYLRVSTAQQEQLRQEYMLDRLGIKFDKTYEDKITGKVIDRPSLNRMMFDLKSGDIVYCESISRLGRNLKDLIDIVDKLVAREVRVIIVKEGIDTSNSTYKLLLGIFGAVAEMERETIQQRIVESVGALKEKKETTGEIGTKSGKWFGREKITKETLPTEFLRYYSLIKSKDRTKVEVAKILGVGRQTLDRWIKIQEGEN